MIDESSAIYQLFLRNFTPEGTFAAAIPRLEGIAAFGFDWICLTPIHPIGSVGRKGSLGSPYAISDYRAIDPALGRIDDFRAFLEEAHGLGLKVMIDIVYNHSSPDSVLARTRPEWFLKAGTGPLAGAAPRAAEQGGIPWGATHDHNRAAGALGRKCADWSDVVDFDYGSSPELWMELMSILAGWREEGVDGFRCDVASLVPVDFWKQARQRVNQYDPGARREKYPLLWLAESVHPEFLKKMRDSGYGAWSEPELHSVFDLSYDYDGWERLEKVWSGERGASLYLEYLYAQETLYPKTARKIRFLENHDQIRAAARFGSRRALEAWTVLYQLIPGIPFSYMGQEYALGHKPELFEKDPVDWSQGDEKFRDFFRGTLAACRRAKTEARRFSWRALGPGVVLLERADAAGLRFAALLDLDGRENRVELPYSLKGVDLLSGGEVALAGWIAAPEKPLIIEISV